MSSSPTVSALRITLAGALLASLAACGGGDDSADAAKKSSGSSSSSSASSSAFTEPGAPVLPARQVVNASAGTLDSLATRKVQVPATNGGVISVATTPLTDGTLTGVTSDDEKERTAPKDAQLVGVLLTMNDRGLATPNSYGSGSIEPEDKPYTVELTAGGKTTQLAKMKPIDMSNGKPMIVSVPKGGGATLTLTADGGKQVIKLDDGQRDDNASAGLPVETVVTVPVASTASCEEAPGKKATLPAMATTEGAAGCSVTWSLADHMDGAGWAPKDGTFLVAHVKAETPSVTYKKGDGLFDEEVYGGTERTVLSGSLGDKPLKVRAGEGSYDGVQFAAAPITKGTRPNRVDLTVTATKTPGFGADGFPAKLKVSMPTMLTGIDTTTTLKVGGRGTN